MEFYDDMAQTALELLQEFGRVVTLRSFGVGGGAGVYDVSTGTIAASDRNLYEDSKRFAVIVDAPLNRVGPQYGQKLETGTLVQENNKWAYLDPKGDAPKLSDQIIFDGVAYNIMNVQTMNPAGKPLLYTLVLNS